ncbi:MAG TPA: hypothetical protein VI893_05320 [Thermoplasmata archaeon]|nr:hypothetical protein [Thermoplasmata archaeon]
MPGVREGNTLVVAAAIVISVLALLVAAMRPPVVVNVPEGQGPAGGVPGARVLAFGSVPGCSWNDTASEFFPVFGYVNEGNRTARNTVANLTYHAAAALGFSAYLDVPLGDVPPYTTGYKQLNSTWVQWGRDVCTREHEFRVTMTWDP